MRPFEDDLQDALAYHGSLCVGQILGVRLARRGLLALDIHEPRSCRDLVTFVETDRCIADAISTVTGCKLGKRRLKLIDYGKSAATFLNMADGKAVRVASIGWARVPEGADLRAYFSALPDSELFTVTPVRVALSPADLPGPPREKVCCSRCGEMTTDSRHVTGEGGAPLCRACAEAPYYTPLIK